MDILLIRWDEVEEVEVELKTKTRYPDLQFFKEVICKNKALNNDYILNKFIDFNFIH